jgi:hypothetical protein
MLPQVISCMNGGGKAAILYDSASSDPCAQYLVTLGAAPGSASITGCPDSTRYVPTATLTNPQGKAIKALLDAKQAVTATVILPDPIENAKVNGIPPRLAAYAS